MVVILLPPQSQFHTVARILDESSSIFPEQQQHFQHCLRTTPLVMSSSDHPHNHNYGSSPPDERIVRQKAQFGPHPAAATRGGHHQSSSASSMHPPPLLVLPPPSASLSAVSSSLMRNLHLHNPSPKPLGSDIQVVASVPVFSDPNLLQDQDSVLEFLGPLLLGGGGGRAENQKPTTIRDAGNHEKLNKHPPFPHAPSQKKRRRTTSTTSSGSHFVDDPPTYHWEGMSASTASKHDSCLVVDEYGTKKRRSSSGNNSNSKGDQEVGLTDHQAALWDRRFQELIDYRQRFGHCLVPHKWPENLALATWVKRQRYQWKLRGQGKRSTLTQERHDALSELGFVWDSHNATWEERFNELVDYKRVHGHTSVPSTDKNHSLSVWVQCQRRQWKLMKEETAESKETAGYRMKENRVERLEALGFVWEPRKQQQQQEGGK